MARTPARGVLAGAAALALLAPVAGQSQPAAAPDALTLARQTAERVGTTLAPDTGPISSDNVELVTTIPGSFAGIKIVGQTAYATGWAGLVVLDISAPDAPAVMGVQPLPHFENEDVDSDGKIVLISNDREREEKGGVVYVIDVKNPAAPTIASVLPIGQLLGTERGPGHIANCVKDGCGWVWLTGGKRIWVLDLHDPTHPVLVGAFATPAAEGSKRFVAGATHEVERDAQGRLWVSGSGGVAVYDGRDVVHPKLLAYTGKQGIDPGVNDFILHNSKHPSSAKYKASTAKQLKSNKKFNPGDVLLVTEEDYVDDAETPPGGCKGQGKFQTWDVRNYDKKRTPVLISQWKTELGEVPDLQGGNKAPLTAFCSSHWFTERRGFVANGWYEQGSRFLDVRNPKDIRQIGYFLPPNAETWASYWITDEIVYTADVLRGIDVLRVNTKGPLPTVKAPIRAGWLGAGTSVKFLTPSASFGACLVPDKRLWPSV